MLGTLWPPGKPYNLATGCHLLTVVQQNMAIFHFQVGVLKGKFLCSAGVVVRLLLKTSKDPVASMLETGGEPVRN